MGVRGWSSGEEGGGKWGGAERLVPEEKIHDPEHTFFFLSLCCIRISAEKNSTEGGEKGRKGKRKNIKHRT